MSHITAISDYSTSFPHKNKKSKRSMNPLAPEYNPSSNKLINSSNSEYFSFNFPQNDLYDSSNFLVQSLFRNNHGRRLINSLLPQYNLQNLVRNIVTNRSMNPLAPNFYPRSWNRNI